jgi:hypothetical protein
VLALSLRMSIDRLPNDIKSFATRLVDEELLSELPWAGSTNLKRWQYQLGQKTTIVDCVSNRPVPCDLYSAYFLQDGDSFQPGEVCIIYDLFT